MGGAGEGIIVGGLFSHYPDITTLPLRKNRRRHLIPRAKSDFAPPGTPQDVDGGPPGREDAPPSDTTGVWRPAGMECAGRGRSVGIPQQNSMTVGRPPSGCLA